VTEGHARPSVLVVVPTLGERPDYLSRTLDSLESQTGIMLEVVVVAPASATAARAECARRGHVFVEQEGRGMGNAINLGWRARGESSQFWGWLGDDDELMPDSLRTTAEHLRRHPGVVMVYGRCRYVDADGELLFEARPGRLAGRLLRWGPDLVPQPGSLARASAVSLAGFLDESLRYAMDLDLFLRLKDQGSVHYLPVALAAFRWHAGSTTVSGLAASEAEAREVRRRTWVRRRRVGRVVEPFAVLAGRVLHRLQRRVP
jgi:glycosyltransferase involved in cell wall biosynthesis